MGITTSGLISELYTKAFGKKPKAKPKRKINTT
jgi:hypothetical protein